MKCPNCGLMISEKRRRCSRCGTPLRAVDTPTNPRVAEPVEEASAAVPEWRKEISQKVRAYGERKKYLTTPPAPLKEEGPPEPRISLVPHPEENFEPPAPPLAPAEKHQPVLDEKSASPLLRRQPKPSRDPFPGPSPMNRSEIHAVDYAELLLPEPEEDAEGEVASLFLTRRLSALIVDTLLIAILCFAGLWFVGWLYDKDWQAFFASVRLKAIGLFLLGHCLYYVYFYKTSRQTPGQVFFSLELRVPGLNRIPVGKILVRWFCMVFFNIFNYVPLFVGKRFLLLDLLSGTEIRSLR